MSASTCGDAECALPKGHGGVFHVGPEITQGIHDMWPTKAGRVAAAERGITGRVQARLAAPGEEPPASEAAST